MFGTSLRYLFSILIISLTTHIAVADFAFAGDTEPMEWGEVPNLHWEIMSFPDDDEAHSIILGDYGETFISNKVEVIHTRYLRIKILDVDKSDFTEFAVSVYTEGRTENLRRIKAQTLNLNPDGSVNGERVRRREMHKEKSGNYETTRFAFPNIQPGSIVEVTYTIESKSVPFLRPWDFQHSSPILVSDYRVLIPREFNFLAYTYGFEPFEESSTETHNQSFVGYANLFPSDSYTEYHWTLKNAPAIRSEPFITTVDDYKNRVDFQLSGYEDNRGFYKNVLTTWDNAVTELAGNRYFGREISSNRSMRRMVGDMIDGMDDKLEIAKLLYDFVASEISWNKKFRVFIDDGVSDALDDRNGSSSEKALLLVSLLDIADIKAYPVLISTRENGKVHWDYPRIAQFNHVLVKLDIDGDLYILDPLFKEIPFGMVLPSSLNGGGLAVIGEKGEFVEIDALVGSSKDTRAMFTLDEHGGMNGTIQSFFTGYEAIMHRLKMEEQSPEEYFTEEFLTEFSETEIKSHQFSNVKNLDERLEARVVIGNNNYVLAAGDMLYINPFFVDRKDENPFRNPVRNFPVEHAYGVQNSYSASIQIPEDYEIIELPEDRVFKLDDDTIFVIQTMAMPNQFQIMTRFLRTGTTYPAGRYSQIRDYYNDIATVYNEQVVLRKKAETEAATSDEREHSGTGTGDKR